jgi:hypothetical protein
MRLRSGGTYSNVAALLGLASGTIAVMSEWRLAALSLGAAAILCMAVSFKLQRAERSELARRAAEIVARVSLDQLLFEAVRGLQLGNGQGGWRVSLYRLDMEAGLWRHCGCTANNERYSVSSERRDLSLGQGVLRDAINGSEQIHGRTEETPVFPSRLDEPEKWLETHRLWGVPEDLARQLSMPTRKYCARVFKVDVRDGRGQTLALVVETDTADGVSKSVLEASLTRPFFESLAALNLLLSELQKEAASVAG